MTLYSGILRRSLPSSQTKCLCYNQYKMKRDGGFTLIEVILFLAISSALLLVAILTSGNLARHSRFSDTVNTYHSLIQRQYEEVMSGVNTRTSGPGIACSGPTTKPGEDSCIVLGKVISFRFDSSAGFVRYVRAPNTSIANVGDVYSQLAVIAPTVEVLTTAEEPTVLQWGATIQEASRSTDEVAAGPYKAGSSPHRGLINAVAFLRGPNTSEPVPYYFYYSGNDTAANVQAALRTALLDPSLTARTTAALCIINADDGLTNAAAITLGGGRGTSGIDTNFQPTPLGPNGICS